MSKKSFENFGRLAKNPLSFTEIAGWYAFQAGTERYILFDIMRQLKLVPSDDLLEIGCGAGNNLIPFSFFAHSATGVDHQALLKVLKKRIKNTSIRCIPGNFLDVKIPGHFSKIIVYSVLHYLSNEKEVLFFIDKAVKLLLPGGKLLLGNIPNIDRKKRFLASPRGKIFEKKWQAMKKKENIDIVFSNFFKEKNVIIGDTLINKIIKTYSVKEFRAKSLKQSLGAPFSHTRENILISRLR